MSKILVVDDEPTVLQAFEALLVDEGHQVLAARNADLAIGSVQNDAPDLVIMDVCMPGTSGLDALLRIKASHPRLPVIVMTGRGTMQTAVEATKRGAFEYQLKPFEPSEMLQLVDKALRGVELMHAKIALDPSVEATSGDALIGHGPAMQAVYKAIGRVARTDSAVLIRGEPGTGKELVARAIYQNSLRSDAPLYVVSCLGAAESQLAVELFGREAAANQDAPTARVGKLEQACGGTLLLDEIGALSTELQARLIPYLQAAGRAAHGPSPAGAPVRYIVTSNRDLERMLAAGELLPDFYHQCGAVTIRLPALRERSEDIPRLAEFFLARCSQEVGFNTATLSNEALQLLCRYPWSGNVRQLQACLRRALIFAGSEALQVDDIERALETSGTAIPSGPSHREHIEQIVRSYLDRLAGSTAHEQLLLDVEREMLVEALRRTRGNRSHAAVVLGISRPTLHAKMNKHGIDASQFS